MNYEEYLIMFVGLFIIIFVIDYFLINKKRLNLIKNKGKTKKGKNKKVKSIGEIDYLIAKFHLKESKLNKDQVIIWVSIINSFIISFTSCIVMMLNTKKIWQFLIAFVLLFSLIYALYEIYGRSLVKKVGTVSKKSNNDSKIVIEAKLEIKTNNKENNKRKTKKKSETKKTKRKSDKNE